ncbi:MAG: Crp/Fnr family transcriptional regulator [Bacteroidales bacterium]|nr:Crp/Fnr family transcriptional regulator [Bacteroidales bacterium]
MANTCNCDQCELRSLFFNNVSKEELDSLCTLKIERTYPKGELIVEEGNEIREFNYLKSGLVKLYKSTDEREQIITIAKPFDFISLLSIFSNNVYNYSVRALEDSVTCNISITRIKDLIKTNGTFALELLEKMNRIADSIIIESLNIRRKHLRGRIAHVLLFFAGYIYNAPEFELPISRKEIAEYIGMTTENVIRTLSEFRKDKIIKINGKIIEIINRDLLERISQLG